MPAAYFPPVAVTSAFPFILICPLVRPFAAPAQSSANAGAAESAGRSDISSIYTDPAKFGISSGTGSASDARTAASAGNGYISALYRDTSEKFSIISADARLFRSNFVYFQISVSLYDEVAAFRYMDTLWHRKSFTLRYLKSNSIYYFNSLRDRHVTANIDGGVIPYRSTAPFCFYGCVTGNSYRLSRHICIAVYTPVVEHFACFWRQAALGQRVAASNGNGNGIHSP